jgi:hypothetical protein
MGSYSASPQLISISVQENQIIGSRLYYYLTVGLIIIVVLIGLASVVFCFIKRRRAIQAARQMPTAD